MASLLDRFNTCEMCRRPISDNVLCMDCNNIKKKAQQFAMDYDATTKEISEEFNISESLIKKWVKNAEFKCVAPCRSCGKLIKPDSICFECRSRFAMELKR